MTNLPSGMNIRRLHDEFWASEGVGGWRDNIRFYFYTVHRVRSLVELRFPYCSDHNCAKTNVAKGRFAEFEFDRDWIYGECGLDGSKLAIGQPNGFISVIDVAQKKLLCEFSAFPDRAAFMYSDFIWSDVAMDANFIFCSGGSPGRTEMQETKIFSHGGELLLDGLPFGQLLLNGDTLTICYNQTSSEDVTVPNAATLPRFAFYHIPSLVSEQSRQPIRLIKYPPETTRYAQLSYVHPGIHKL